MSKNKALWLLFVILIIATFLRFYHITTAPPGLYPDEAVNGNNALQALRAAPPADGFRVFYPDNNGREGLFINIQAFFLKVLNSPSQISPGEIWQGKPWVLRLPSAIAGVLTVLGVYFLAAALFGEETGLLAAFFLATNFWHINFSRIGFRAILAPLFLVWATYFLIKAFRADKAIFYFPFSIFSGIIFGLGFYTYIAYRIMPLLALFVIIYFLKKHWREIHIRKKILLSAFYFLLSAFIAALPIGLYFLKYPADFFGRTSELSIFASATPWKDLAGNIVKTLAMFNFRGDQNWRHNISGAPELFWPVGILFVIGIAIAIKNFIGQLWHKIKNRAAGGFSIFNFPAEGRSLPIQSASRSAGKQTGASGGRFSILLFWFLLALLPVAISNEGIPHALRSILLLPPAIIFAAVGGVKLYKFFLQFGAVRFVKAAAYAALAAITASAYLQYFIVWAKNPNVAGAFNSDYVQIGEQINSLPADTAKYVVVEAGGVLVNNIPMPAQTVMFITDTYSRQGQADKNIHYILPQEESGMPPEAKIFYIK